ncbi:DNA polymerase III subunit gamma/tau [Mycoplasmopsis felis]|nr:DNA polymerase III subunit gamma/tau [Mycoplasmopsis felis]MCU9931674.1 DNA polymerase III subunit gamma/tau [Mycoplasmopsis felis]
MNQKISHAYLFAGTKGTGKTSVAKIFANVLNCNHNNELTKSYINCLNNYNTNFDIIEMDAASNNGVDEIRVLKEKVEQVPIQSKYKIYIIDEVHMLTKSAFNALLKTLEEPPKHIIFILATTDPQKIPLTILSRVQRFNFQRVSIPEIVNHLKFILNKEQINYQDNALRSIAYLSSGGLRDALSLLEQVSSFNNHNITEESINEIFGILKNDSLIKIINLIYENNLDELIENLYSLERNGIDPKQFVISLLNIIKEWILYRKTKNKTFLNLLNEEEIEKIKLTSNLSIQLSKEFYDILTKIQRTEIPFNLIELYFNQMFKNWK